jgi:hypothetical protein
MRHQITRRSTHLKERNNEMAKLMAVLMLLFSLLAYAQGETFDVCGTVTTVQGGSFTWNNPYSQPVRIAPAPGTTWFLGASYIIVPANNGQVTINVPSNAGVGTYNISVTYDSTIGGNPCGGNGANPKIIVGAS